MDIEINPDLDLVNWERISELFELVGWGKRNPQEIELAFRKSTVVCMVKNEEGIIGFGRTVDDGRYYALLVDIVIHPDHQRKGMGSAIVHNLTDQLKGYNFSTLTAALQKEMFYQKAGWKKQKSGYILPVNEKQREEHCEEID